MTALHALRRSGALRTGLAAWLLLTLLLKAALPLLASQSAALQGKATAEVCTAYGVATIALDGSPAPHPASDAAAHHGGEHCPAGAALALVLPTPAGPVFQADGLTLRQRLPAPDAPALPDAGRRWQASRAHAPPALA